MATVGEAHAAWRQLLGLARWLGIAVLFGILAGSGEPGGVTAHPRTQDAAPAAGWQHTDSPGLPPPDSDDPHNACLQLAWVFVQEESSESSLVYRPAVSALPPARGRFGYEFLAGGQLLYRGIGPADGPLSSPGQWAWVAPDQIHIVVNDLEGAYIDETLRILSCDANLLRVEPASAPEGEMADTP